MIASIIEVACLAVACFCAGAFLELRTRNKEIAHLQAEIARGAWFSGTIFTDTGVVDVLRQQIAQLREALGRTLDCCDPELCAGCHEIVYAALEASGGGARPGLCCADLGEGRQCAFPKGHAGTHGYFTTASVEEPQKPKPWGFSEYLTVLPDGATDQRKNQNAD